MSTAVIELSEVSKSFPGVAALDRVSFSLEKGEVRALVGKNGAGKSTLIKIITGVYAADSGEYRIDGTQVADTAPYALRSMGIRAIYQENDLIPFFTVGQSVMLNNEILGRGPFLDSKAIHRKAGEILSAKLGFDIDPYALVNDLDVAHKQIVQIARALVDEPKVLIFDEPTASLSSAEIEVLFRIIEDLKKRRVSIVYISHRLDEIFRVADKVTVMRDGKKIIDKDMEGVTENDLIKYISGEESRVARQARAKPIGDGPAALKVRGLKAGMLNGIDFDLRKSEILGVFGAEGAGQQELAQAVFGLIRGSTDECSMEGKPFKLSRPIDAIRSKIGYVPRDRKGEGLVIDFSVRENVTLADLRNYSKGGFVSGKSERSVADDMISRLAIKTPGRETTVRTLSGGNQQKVVIARWLAIDLKILLLDYPTAGIDIQAKGEVYRILRRLSDEGSSVLLITPEYEEIKALCDRVMVMRDGEIAATFDVEKTTEEELMAWAIGSKRKAALEGAKA